MESVVKGHFDLDTFTTFDDKYYIMNTSFKSLCCVGAVSGHLNATLTLAKRYDIKPEEVASVKITAGTRPIDIQRGSREEVSYQ